MKRDCERAGVATPRYVFAYDEAGVERAVREVPLPAFAKPHHGYCSIGIDEGSRVTTADALRARVRKLINDHGGALVEEYIDGREVSVLVSTNPLAPDDPYVYLPVEWLAGVGVPFKTLAVKWYGSKNAWIAVDDTALVDRLKGVSRAAWLASNGDGYARLDIRIDARGEPYVLDVNANCGLFYIDEDGGTADLIVMLDGVGKAGFLARMIAHALHRAGHTVANIR
jgi:D-alanine-D-alanine ligase